MRIGFSPSFAIESKVLLSQKGAAGLRHALIGR
jgi:hypothetical protein